MAEIDRLVVRLQADISDLKRGMRGAESTVKRSSTRMQRSFVGVNNSLKKLTAGAGKLRTALIGIGGIHPADRSIGIKQAKTSIARGCATEGHPDLVGRMVRAPKLVT